VGEREDFTRGAANSPPVQHSLRKKPLGLRRKQTEIVTADKNRRQKVVNRGALRFCGDFTFVQGGLTFKFDTKSTIL